MYMSERIQLFVKYYFLSKPFIYTVWGGKATQEDVCMKERGRNEKSAADSRQETCVMAWRSDTSVSTAIALAFQASSWRHEDVCDGHVSQSD